MKFLLEFHRIFKGSVRWRINPELGVEIQNTTPKPPSPAEAAAASVLVDRYGHILSSVSRATGVPVELLGAVALTESGGNEEAIRQEPHYIDDQATPNLVSVGICQLLLSTAREAMQLQTISRKDLLSPVVNIRCAAEFIRRQKPKTEFDPPVVACAYNAGGVYEQTGAYNRWKMRQFPIGTAKHADRFVSWFNALWIRDLDGFRFKHFLEEEPPANG